MAPAQVVEAKDLPQELLMQQQSTAPAAALPAATPTLAAGMPASSLPAEMPLAGSAPSAGSVGAAGSDAWVAEMAREARRLLAAGEPEVWDALTRRFEASLILTALELTRGRRIEAAQKLGIGRNTITRKIQELGLDA
jgi:two-component system nitrogen regulation response regulator GlnG